MRSEAIPPSVNLLDSMRSVGYSLEAALADIIDNSIAASAHNVTIDVDVVDGQYISILDDGVGMSPDKAREALRLAGTEGKREQADLGRFGLGLKTASLSQARRLVVVTKQQDVVTALSWDIDFVRESGQWLLQVLDSSELGSLPLWSELQTQESGTLVAWSNLDLLLGDADNPGIFLSSRLDDVRSSLSLVFHRFLSDIRDKFTIEVNGLSLEAIDPFLSDNPKTQRTPPETIKVGGEEVRVAAFTLPHASGLTAKERRRPDIGVGMRDAQGFYVYRNRRLISKGHWYGLARMSELSKQTRVQVDVPSSLDSLWQLDIKKSRAEPPQTFKTRLRQLIDPILEGGKRVHTFRGRAERTSVQHLWKKLETREGFGYEVNMESPIVQSALSSLPSVDAERVVMLLQTLANTFPIEDAYLQAAQNTPVYREQLSEEDLIARLRGIYKLDLYGTNSELAASALARIEPFNDEKDLAALVARVWKDPDGTN